jgi:cyclase
MISKRIIPVIIIKNGHVVQSFNFDKYLPIGKPEYIIKYLSTWESDEIVVLDIDASINKRLIDSDLLRNLSKIVNVPLTIGGGVSSLEDAEFYFKNGADKISVNSLFLDSKFSIINSISEEFGSQSIVLSLDFKQIVSGDHYLFDYRKKELLDIDIYRVFETIKNEIHFGEVLINSVDRDGSKLGYDRKLFEIANTLIDHPILSLGGANQLIDFIEMLEFPKITGLCAANVFFHSEHSVELLRSKINNQENILRPNNYFSYEQY